MGDHDVDLRVKDVALRLDVLGGEEDAEDVIAVALHRRPRLVPMLRGPEQELEGALLELPRCLRS